jgi:hypothetical protein
MAGKLILTKPAPGGYWRYNTPCAIGLKDNGNLFLLHVEANGTPIWEQLTPPPVSPANNVIDLEVVTGGMGATTVPVVLATTKQGEVWFGVVDTNLDLPSILDWESLGSPPP